MQISENPKQETWIIIFAKIIRLLNTDSHMDGYSTADKSTMP